MLNKDGQYGARTPSSGKVGILHLVEDSVSLEGFIASPPSEPSILVMPAPLLTFSTTLIDDLQKIRTVEGLILLDEHSPKIPLSPFSPVFPEKDESGFAWNPSANSLYYKALPFPLWLFGPSEAPSIREHAIANKGRLNYPYNAAQITNYMFPDTKENSFICLSRGTCDPVGGHSLWTSIGQMDVNKEIVVSMCAMDTKSLFQHKTIGANSAMSATVANIVAMETLLKNTNVSNWKKQVVFAWFDAESFGNLGSRKFLSDINNYNQCLRKKQSNCGTGKSYMDIDLDNITSVIELKQVGAVTGSGFYVHTQNHKVDGKTAKTFFDVGAFSNIKVERAAPETPGVPPSSFKSFLDIKPSFSDIGVVITDHAGPYENKFFESIFDDERNVNASRVCQAATLLARGLYALGNDLEPSGGDPLFSELSADCEVVQRLLYCLTANTTCTEVLDILPSISGAVVGEYPIHYSGVFSSTRRSIYQKFIHDYVYEKAAFSYGINCTDNSVCTPGYCIKNRCAYSNTFYHDAATNNVEVINGEFYSYYHVINTSDTQPLWTESQWSPQPALQRVRLFKLGSPSIDYAFLVIAIAEIVITVIVVFACRKKFTLWFKISRD
uniref:Nicastrin n=1 Tax=Arcella intermedia TaxID=1963864 RepID=A0A6B2KZU5_9EUKA